MPKEKESRREYMDRFLEVVLAEDTTTKMRAAAWLDLYRSDLERQAVNQEAFQYALMYTFFLRLEKFVANDHYQRAMRLEMQAMDHLVDEMYAPHFVQAAILELECLNTEVFTALFEGVRLKDSAGE